MSTPLVPLAGMFLEGVTEDGDRIVLVASEEPERLAGFEETLSGEVLERFHLEWFRSSYLLRRGEVPFNTVERSSDPPDFEVTTPEGPERVDCAALALEARRLSYRLFDHLRRKLLGGAGNRDFSGIRECLVSVWFGETLSDLPPPRWDDAVIEPLLVAMEACQIDRVALARLNEEISQHGFPEKLPPIIPTGRTPDGQAGFIANLLPASPGNVGFSKGLPFEISLHRPSEVRLADVQSVFERLVQSHDKPEIEHLILTAGGPDQHGFRYPAEEAVARVLIREGGVVGTAQFLKRISVHLWSMREVSEIPIVRPE